MKKKLMSVLAIVLVIAMSVAGTYAYLTSLTLTVLRQTPTSCYPAIPTTKTPWSPLRLAAKTAMSR